MFYELKIYLYKSIHKISISCDEDFYNTILDTLDDNSITFLNLNDVIIRKASIKKITVKKNEPKIKTDKNE